MVNKTVSSAEVLQYDAIEKICIIIFLAFLSIGATGGNMLTFLAYRKMKFLQRPTNYSILSLAAADFIIATFVVNFHTMYMVGGWPYNILSYDVCLFWLLIDYWSFQVSVFGVILIAGDRYLSIKFPNGYREFRTKTRVIYIIIANWIISFLIWVPLILVYGYKNNTKTEMIEKNYCDVGSEKVVPATVIGCLVSYILPVFIILGLAIDSVRVLMKLKQKFNNHKMNTITLNIQESSSSSEVERIGLKPSIATIHNAPPSTKTSTSAIEPIKGKPGSKRNDEGKKSQSPLFNPVVRLHSYSKSINQYQWIATFNMLLGISFIVNILPFGVLAVTRSVCHVATGESCVSQKWWFFGYIMCYLNSMLNPVCYALGNKNFKKAFKQLLSAKRERRQSSAASYATEDSVYHLRRGANKEITLDRVNKGF